MLGPLAALKGTLSAATRLERWATEKWATHIGVPVFDPIFDFFEQTRIRKAIFTLVVVPVAFYTALVASGSYNPSTGAFSLTPMFALSVLLAVYINIQMFASALGVSVPGSHIDLIPESWTAEEPIRTDGGVEKGDEDDEE